MSPYSLHRTHKISQINSQKGITLIELTVVIVVLIMLISVLFVGANAYKRSADRAACLLTIRKVQLAVRSVQNLEDKSPGDSGLDKSEISDFAGIDLNTLTCPADANYTFISDSKYPVTGVAALKCDLEVTEKHIPQFIERW